MAKQEVIPSGDDVRIKFSTGRVIKRTQAVQQKAFTQVARQMKARLKKAISRQGPPRSRSGNYPKKDSGDLHGSVDVVVTSRGDIRIKMLKYGMFLDNEGKGFRHHVTGKRVKRPWYTPLIFKDRKNWERKLNAAMRKHSK